MKLDKTGVISSANVVENLVFNDMGTKILNDGSFWVRILHHNNKGGTVLFTSSNVMNIQTEDLYSRLYALEAYRDVSGSFEFMAIQPEISETTIYRWKQSNNPTNTTILTDYVNITNGQGGLVKCSSGTLCAVSTTTSNWWCAVGSYSPHQGGIPGFGNKVVTQSLDLYVRVYINPEQPKFSVNKNFIIGNELYEY